MAPFAEDDLDVDLADAVAHAIATDRPELPLPGP
ncbi:hypothetical protein P3T27_004143 [Kitasatospora sp. MAA19]|nr:hypothetical protein [Kitasatospora sp. MAA19]